MRLVEFDGYRKKIKGREIGRGKYVREDGTESIDFYIENIETGKVQTLTHNDFRYIPEKLSEENDLLELYKMTEKLVDMFQKINHEVGLLGVQATLFQAMFDELIKKVNKLEDKEQKAQEE